MAGANAYKLLLEAQLDPKKVDAQIKALSNKSVFYIKTQFDPKDMRKFESELAKIVSTVGNKVGKISLLGDDTGKINKAVVDYTDKLGNAVKQTIAINDKVKITQTYTENLAKNEAGIVKLKEQQAKLSAKQSDEMERAALAADKFLAKSQNMAKSPQVAAAVSTAQQIKVAVADGDIAKVRELNNQLAIQKSALSAVGQGVRSWTESLGNAIKQTISYSMSIGLVYGALNQLKEGIQYLTDLNKEMTAVQIVTGYSDEKVAGLALTYNKLAKDLGATTLEVAKGSTEWFRQGKTIEETSKLMESSMMMSKLANMESAQATEYLTSILNGFKLEAEDAEDVISKLVALDNAFATSTGEIASAMQRSSVSAQQAGVSMEELASMIAVVSDVSRRAPENIGESFPA